MNWTASALVATVVKQRLQEPAGLLSRARSSIALVESAQRASASNLLSSVVMTIPRLDVINNSLQVDELQQVLVKYSRCFGGGCRRTLPAAPSEGQRPEPRQLIPKADVLATRAAREIREYCMLK